MTLPVAGILFLSNTIGGILLVLIVAVWLVGLYDVIFKRHDLSGGQRMAWVLLIVLLPLIGTIAYFAMRPTLSDEAEHIIASRTGPR